MTGFKTSSISSINNNVKDCQDDIDLQNLIDLFRNIGFAAKPEGLMVGTSVSISTAPT